jgi:chemotaxis family two-component system response regulator Rcp1
MKSFNIVLAEDNPADIYLIRQALTEHQVSCDVCVVKDGKSAIRLFSDRSRSNPPRPDLILLDLNLPQHDGIEILKAIRGRSELSQVPVAILSSSESPRDHRAANALGVVQYIQKPLELDAFMSLGKTIKELLRDASAPDAGPPAVRIYEWQESSK